MSQSSTPVSELPAVGFLADVSSEHRSFLACFGKFLRPQSGEVLIEEGAAQESLYVILSGTLHIVTSLSDRPVLLAAFGEGDSIGEINLFDPATASATAVMRSSGLVWVVSRDEFEAFVAADPAAGVAVMGGLLRQVARRIRSMNEKLLTAGKQRTILDYWNSGTK